MEQMREDPAKCTLEIDFDGKFWYVHGNTEGIRKGDLITWTLDVPDARAVLQFPRDVFDTVDNDPPTSGGQLKKLSRHQTAQVYRGTPLTLQVSGKAHPDGKPVTYQYAVFVIDPRGERSGFAIGHNPPPEINVGP